MIKILHVISDTNFGGAGRVLLNYLSCYDSTQFDVAVVVPENSKLRESLDPKKYNVYPMDGLYDRSYSRKDVHMLKKLIGTLQPDIVHSHGALSARIAAKECGKRIVYTRHSIFDLPAWQTSFPGKQALGLFNNFLADRVIAVSPAAVDLLVSCGSDPKKIKVVYNGVHQQQRAEEEVCQALRQQYGVEKEDFVLSIVARLTEVKGHKDIISAAKILKDAGLSNIKILIAGTGGNEQQLREYAAQLDVTDIVKFIGFITDVAGLYSITDVQLNASFGTEATSMALLEGFSMGVPAIASNFGGNPYVVRNGESGLLFEKRNAAALYRAIRTIYEDTALYKTLSEGAFALYQKEFTVQAMTHGMEAIYLQLMEDVKK